MTLAVASTACLQCSFGAAPGVLTILPTNRTFSTNLPVATLMDHTPMLNIAPFGVCSSPSNPTVAAATAAALGVLVPMPCVPMTSAPWIPGGPPKLLLAGMAVLDANAMLMGNWGGVIKVVAPGQSKVMLP
jgi:hypothetical protein